MKNRPTLSQFFNGLLRGKSEWSFGAVDMDDYFARGVEVAVTFRGKVNLCIISPSFNGGGAERIAVNLANYYSSKGHYVFLIVLNGVGPYREQVSSMVHVDVLGVSRARYVFFKLRRILKKMNFDVVLSVLRDVNIFVGFAIFWGKNYRLIYREATTMDAIVQRPYLWRVIYKTLMRVAYARANRIICNSNDTQNDLLINKIVSKAKSTVVENPVLPENYLKLADEPINHPWLGKKGFKVLLNVGRLHKHKNQEMLIRSFAEARKKIDSLRLIILGEGTEKENLMNVASQLGVASDMQILGFKRNPYPFYRNADLFVLTSRWEGFGNVLVEAMACGVPVISTNCPGGPKMILAEGKYGLLVPLDDINELSRVIVNKLNEPQDFGNLESARLRAQEFSIQSVAEKYFLEMLR